MTTSRAAACGVLKASSFFTSGKATFARRARQACECSADIGVLAIALENAVSSSKSVAARATKWRRPAWPSTEYGALNLACGAGDGNRTPRNQLGSWCSALNYKPHDGKFYRSGFRDEHEKRSQRRQAQRSMQLRKPGDHLAAYCGSARRSIPVRRRVKGSTGESCTKALLRERSAASHHMAPLRSLSIAGQCAGLTPKQV